jgi:hypothetical protein
VAAGAVVALWPFVEYGIHRGVLHRPPVRLGRRTLDLAPGHRAHHADPGRPELATLPGGAALADAAALAGLAALLTPGRPARPTAALTAVACLGAYEWIHLRLHTGPPARSRWLRARRAGHLRHHHRDDTRWFGVTTGLVDRLVESVLEPAVHARAGHRHGAHGTVAGTAAGQPGSTSSPRTPSRNRIASR